MLDEKTLLINMERMKRLIRCQNCDVELVTNEIGKIHCNKLMVTVTFSPIDRRRYDRDPKLNLEDLK